MSVIYSRAGYITDCRDHTFALTAVRFGEKEDPIFSRLKNASIICTPFATQNRSSCIFSLFESHLHELNRTEEGVIQHSGIPYQEERANPFTSLQVQVQLFEDDPFNPCFSETHRCELGANQSASSKISTILLELIANQDPINREEQSFSTKLSLITTVPNSEDEDTWTTIHAATNFPVVINDLSDNNLSHTLAGR